MFDNIKFQVYKVPRHWWPLQVLVLVREGVQHAVPYEIYFCTPFPQRSEHSPSSLQWDHQHRLPKLIELNWMTLVFPELDQQWFRIFGNWFWNDNIQLLLTCCRRYQQIKEEKGDYYNVRIHFYNIPLFDLSKNWWVNISWRFLDNN